MTIYDPTPRQLGEGPLWHPLRRELLWFDIFAHQLLLHEGGKTRTIQFDEQVSAAGWVDSTRLLIASETRLFLFDLDSEAHEDVAPLEPDNPDTRSNDGRADPWGGFWIGTMAKSEAPEKGAIYRYYRGEVRRLYPGISIPNAISFSPDRRYAYWADTPTKMVMRQPLDPKQGWPAGAAQVWLDLSSERLNPDGAVVDAAGKFWNAQWGAGRVACYAPDGTFLREVRFDAAQTSCPAFGGEDMTTLFCTSATKSLNAPQLSGPAHHGCTFAEKGVAKGLPEHRVEL